MAPCDARAMRGQFTDLFSTPEDRAYQDEIRRRDRRATWATRSRYLLIHLSWIIVLLAGAGISLGEALTGTPDWVTPLLGFVVVVFQGIGRVFGRTSSGSLAMDQLRRGLGRERRLVLVGGGPYGGG